MTAPMLTAAQGQRLVALARWTLAAHFSPNDPALPSEPDVSDPVFAAPWGTFVTLKIGGGLRGCIGRLSTDESLADGIRHNAISAAFQDPRFPPLSAQELSQVAISISVLTPAQPLEHRGGGDLLDRLKPGRDGVIIRKGGLSATFLPQVWEDLTEPAHFLTALCRKAGLPGSAWKDASLDVSVYQALYFQEASQDGRAGECHRLA